ncbi:peroxidase 5 [Ricinus communis]|uniref:Peroxidase n=1 Tax=Ricinus communis TaxID=3988 RepID=B9RT46_RICCO|nr:peroxidase 5 [Ricinus communis]EEF45529.1 Cationic peroxidase 2 precursor, putative [Ricinus communis]|eukprot:XP_002516915.1 peroxidase 5 [Ricinus communis]
MAKIVILLIYFLPTFFISSALSAQLKKGFYQKTCPLAETLVRSTVKNALASDAGIPAALIRLHFHDCFVRGCDASILLNSTPGNKAEKESMGNKGVGGFEVIDEAKAKIESYCPNTVSCADIIAFAARDSVLLSGGTYYDVPGGRRDGTTSLISEVTGNLPDSFFNATQLKQNFANKGLSLEEMVTLSGAHSIGDSHCSSFSKRLYSFNATYSQDPSLDPVYASYLKIKCPRHVKPGLPDPVVPFDPLTPTRLDSNYYKNLKNDKGLLFSDQVLWNSELTKKIVNRNIRHPNKWASKFAAAMGHMGSIEVITGSQGEIRKYCWRMN